MQNNKIIDLMPLISPEKEYFPIEEEIVSVSDEARMKVTPKNGTDLIKNSVIPVHLRSKLNYFYTPYNPNFAFNKGN
jgi:hypothetical protein